MKFILALDQGTTSSRALLVAADGRVHGSAQAAFKQIFPKPGWVEHDPIEIWSSQFGVAMDALAQGGIGAESIAAIGITNQRETTIVWDAKAESRSITRLSGKTDRCVFFGEQNPQWDDDLLRLFDIPANMLPEVVGSAKSARARRARSRACRLRA